VFWLDICLICMLLWGGAKGYMEGLKNAGWNFLLIIISLQMAHMLKNNVMAILTTFYPLDKKVQKIISSQPVVPVEGGRGAKNGSRELLPELRLPPVIKEKFLDRLPAEADSLTGYAGEDIVVAEQLTKIFLNVWGFSVAAIIFYGLLNVFKKSSNSGKPFTLPTGAPNYLAVFLGLGRYFILASLLISVAGVIYLVYPPVYAVLGIEESVLAEWCLYLYDAVGVWW